jgi:hypothetical protein
MSGIPKALRSQVFERAKGRCQYCQLAQVGQGAVFHINHIIPRSKAGLTIIDNLALQCPYCSLHKTDKLTGADPVNGELNSLFHPLQQIWSEHFAIDIEGVCHGKTSIGRSTVQALRMNDPLPRVARVVQIRIGLLTITAGSSS